MSESKTLSPIERFWEDVDGRGTPIDDAMPYWWDLAATFGHVGLYFELPAGREAVEGEVVTAADQGMPYVCPYTPLDIIDWLTDEDGVVISVKLLEAIPKTDYMGLRNVTEFRVRVVDQQGWHVYDARTGAEVQSGTHGLGRLPMVFLFGKRRPTLIEIGQSVLGDPKHYIDVYNLTSELRELLRNQTFSFINIPLGTGPDAPTVEQAQLMMGKQIGTMNVIFSPEQASILSADAQNVVNYQEEIQRVKRDIYRETGVQWESDSKDAEAEGSLQLKREEMNTRLSAYADECQRVEMELVDLFYRYEYGAEQAEQKIEADQVTVQYPETFAPSSFEELLGQLQAAQSGGYPPIFLKELRKLLMGQFEGMNTLPPETLKAMVEAIDSAQDDLSPADQLKMKLEAQAGAFGGKGKAVEKPEKGEKDDPEKDDEAAA